MSYWTCPSTDASGGPDAVGGVEVERLFSDSDTSVLELTRRAYSAVRVEGGGKARVAWSSIGLRGSGSSSVLKAVDGRLTSR